jgi:nesprin-1
MLSIPQGKVQAMENRVTEHEHYLEAVRDFNDWLASAKEELQRWSDLSGDSTSVNRKLAKVQVRMFKHHLQYLNVHHPLVDTS